MLMRARSHLVWTVVVLMMVEMLPLSSVSAIVAELPSKLSVHQQLVQPRVIVNTSYMHVRSGPGAIYSSIGVLPGGTELPVLGRNRDTTWWQVSTIYGVGWVSAEFVIPRGDMRIVPVVESAGVIEQPRAAVMGAPVNVYVLPDVGSSLLGIALVGSELPISGKTGDGVWWQVETNVGGGWVRQADVALRGNAAAVPVVTIQTALQPPLIIPAVSSLPTTTTAAPATPITNPVIFVYRGRVQVKDRPSPDGEAVHWFDTGDRAEVFQYSDNLQWVAVEFAFHQRGCVMLTEEAISDPTDPRTQVFFSRPGMLDLRDRPDMSGELTGLIPSLERLAVNGVSPDGRWFLLEHWLGSGWAPADSVDIIVSGPHHAQAPSPAAPVTTVGPVVAQPQLSGAIIQPSSAAIFTAPQPEPVRNYVIVNTSFLNIRSGPGAQYTVVETASGGTELDVGASTPDGIWFLVHGPFGSGWVNSEFVIFRGNFEAVSIIRYEDAIGLITFPEAIVSAPINVYLGPGVETGLLGTAPAGLNLPVVGRSLDGGWLQVQTQLGPGWVLASTVTFRGDFALVPIVR